MIVRTHKISFTPDRTPMPKSVKVGFEGDNMVERLTIRPPDTSRRRCWWRMGKM